MDKLIAATHGPTAARAHRSYALNVVDRDRAVEIGQVFSTISSKLPVLVRD
jgi:hypothetical protein